MFAGNGMKSKMTNRRLAMETLNRAKSSMFIVFKNGAARALIILAIIIASATSEQVVPDISRINNGIYFQGVAKISPEIGSWHHSFLVQIPSKLDKMKPHNELIGEANLTRAPYTQLALETCIRGYDL